MKIRLNKGYCRRNLETIDIAKSEEWSGQLPKSVRSGWKDMSIDFRKEGNLREIYEADNVVYSENEVLFKKGSKNLPEERNSSTSKKQLTSYLDVVGW